MIGQVIVSLFLFCIPLITAAPDAGSPVHVNAEQVFKKYNVLAQQQKNTAWIKSTKELQSVSGGGLFWKGSKKEPEGNVPTLKGDPADMGKKALTSRLMRREIRSLRKCLERAGVKAEYPTKKSGNFFGTRVDSLYWEGWAHSYNERFKYIPEVVVIPDNDKDVQSAVRCAVQDGVKIQARAGGHSYGAYSTGGKDGSMVIDLRRMDQLSYDEKSQEIAAGGGTRLGNLGVGMMGLSSGPRALPHGDCPAVGLAGHSLHGGFGYTSRMWGLSTDAIVALEIVTADGELRYATQSRNTDLFWAARGAADSFGIVTRIWLKTQRAPTDVYHFRYDLSNMVGEGDRMANAFINVQETLQRHPAVNRRFGLTVRLATGSFTIAGYYYGTRSKFDEFCEAMDDALRKPARQNAPKLRLPRLEKTTMNFVQALQQIAGRNPLEQPRGSFNSRANFRAKSVLVPEKNPLSRMQMTGYFNHLVKEGNKFPPNRWVVTFRLMGGRDSQVPARGTNFAAVSYRKSLWIIQHDGQTSEDGARMRTFIEGLNTMIEIGGRGTKYRAFAPFLDPSLSRDESHNLYFGTSTYRKLQQLKARYDPQQAFWNPQSVRPAKKK